MSNVLEKEDPTLKERIEWLEVNLKFRVKSSSTSSESNEVTSTTTQTEKESPSTKSESSPKPPEENRENENQAYRARIHRETEDRVTLVLPGLKTLETKAIGCLPAGDKSLESLRSALDSLETARKKSIYSITEPDLTKFNFAVEQVEKLRREAKAAGELVREAVETEANRRAELRKGIDEHPAQTLIREYPQKTEPSLTRLENETEWRSKLEKLLNNVKTESQSEKYTQDSSAYSEFQEAADELKHNLDKCTIEFAILEKELQEEFDRRTEQAQKLKQDATQRKKTATNFANGILKSYSPTTEVSNAKATLAQCVLSGSESLKPIFDFAPSELSHVEYLLALENHNQLIKSFDNDISPKIRSYGEIEKLLREATIICKDEVITKFFSKIKEYSHYCQNDIYTILSKGDYFNSLDKAKDYVSTIKSTPILINDYKEAIDKYELTINSLHKDLTTPREWLEKKKTGLKATVEKNPANATLTIRNFSDNLSKLQNLSTEYIKAIEQYMSTFNSIHVDFQSFLTTKLNELKVSINNNLINASKTLKEFNKYLSSVKSLSTEYDEAIKTYNSTLKQIDEVIIGPRVPLETLKNRLIVDITKDLANASNTIKTFNEAVLGVETISNAYVSYCKSKEIKEFYLNGTTEEQTSVQERIKAAVDKESLDVAQFKIELETAKNEAIKYNSLRVAFSKLRDELNKQIAPLEGAHKTVHDEIIQTAKTISISDLGYDMATLRINELMSVTSEIKVQLNELTEVDVKGRESIKEVLKEFDSVLRTKLNETEKAISLRCKNSSSTEGQKTLEDLRQIYIDIPVFLKYRKALEESHNYSRTVKNAFPIGGKLGLIRKNFEEAGKKLNFKEAKRNFDELVIRLEVSGKSSETLRRVDVALKSAPKEITGELPMLYEQCKELVKSGEPWSESLKDLLEKCSVMLPKLFEATAEKIRTDMEKSYIEGTQKAIELALVQPQHQFNLAETWNKADSLAKDGKYEDAIKAYEKVPGQLTIITNLHVKLPFLKAWDEYKEEWKRVPIPGGTISDQVTSKANDIWINTTDEVVDVKVINSAKSQIEKLKGLLEYYAKFETQRESVEKDFKELKGRTEKKLHSSQLKSIGILHKAATRNLLDDPISSLAKLNELADRIVDIKAKLENFHGNPVPKPIPKGGSGFEKAATEEDAKNIAVELITDGGITLTNLAKMIPRSTRESFVGSTKYLSGFKYTWTTISGVRLEIYAHGPTVNPKVSEDSDNKRGNVLRIKINDKYLRPDGSLTAKATEATSHMSLY